MMLPVRAHSASVTSAWEAPTLLLLLLCHVGFWVVALAVTSPVAVLFLLVPLLTLYQSLTHEVIHGHPTPSARLNALLVLVPLSLFVPFGWFRDSHLSHHRDQHLTDPFEDPESHYLDPVVWARLHPALQAALRFNNTLVGRSLLGPLLLLLSVRRELFRALRSGERAQQWRWLLHLTLVGALLSAWQVLSVLSPLWLLLAALGSTSLLMLRTFLEHQAHALVRGRSVIIERTLCPFAFLFLFNSLHAVHHAHPRLPWYRLPGFFRSNRARFLRLNKGYSFASYGEVIRRYALRPKDPVAHPLMAMVRTPSSPLPVAAGPLAAGPLAAGPVAATADWPVASENPAIPAGSPCGGVSSHPL